MKLELKHLAGYLPYELKCKTTHSKYKDNYKLIGLDFAGCTFKDFELFYFRITPILRPLSDLTKEIEVNGKKFVPIDWFEHDSVSDYFDGNIWVKFLFEDGKFEDLDFIPYGMIQKFLEWHFDIYGLIDAGLAIDINTLNK